jgi:hypothetical protein
VPLVGGGSAGNPVGGGAPAGTGTSLNYTGDHAYGYSGQLSVTNNPVTGLQFSTPYNSYVEANVQVLWTTTGGEYTGDDALVLVYVDNEVVSGILTSSAHKNASELLKIILPAGSNVKVTINNAGSTTEHYGYLSVTGRVYA